MFKAVWTSPTYGDVSKGCVKGVLPGSHSGKYQKKGGKKGAQRLKHLPHSQHPDT